MTSGTLKTIGLLFSLALARSAVEAQPVITSPAPGSTLTSSSATFQWTSGAGVTEYFLYIGSVKGASDVYSTNANLNLSVSVAGLPTNGMTLYVRLWWLTADGWQTGDYTYTALGVTTPFPMLTSPAPDSTLTSSSATFQWSSGTGVSGYFLYVGSILGASNIYSQNEGFKQSDTVIGLPTNGMTLYVRLWWLASATWQSGDYTNNAVTTLGAQRQGGNFIISWPTNDPAYWLEYTTNPPASAWISNPISPSILKGRYTVTNGTSNPFAIYRLTK